MKINKEKNIPKNTPYCYDALTVLTKDGYYIKQCPYLKYRMTDYGFGGRKAHQEYCTYLHKYLSIQDQVKDCGVSYGYDDIDLYTAEEIKSMENKDE